MKFFPVLDVAQKPHYISFSFDLVVCSTSTECCTKTYTHTLVKRKKGVKIELLFLWRGKLKILLDTVLFTGGL